MKRLAAKGMWGIVCLMVFLTTLFPLVWMLISSFKTNADIVGMPMRFFPSQWVMDNYQTLVATDEFLHSMAMTFLGGALFTLLTLFVNAMAGYSFARIEYPGKGVLWGIVLSTMFIPGISTLITAFIVVTQLGMLNTLWVLLIPGAASAGHIFFIRQFYLNYPLSLEEAAMIDGCTRFKNFLYIFLPSSGAVFVIVGIGAFLGYWNSYLWPVLTISDKWYYTVMQVMQFFKAEKAAKDGLVMAGSVFTSLPPILLFLIFQRYIIQGIKIAGMKG